MSSSPKSSVWRCLLLRFSGQKNFEHQMQTNGTTTKLTTIIFNFLWKKHVIIMLTFLSYNFYDVQYYKVEKRKKTSYTLDRTWTIISSFSCQQSRVVHTVQKVLLLSNSCWEKINLKGKQKRTRWLMGAKFWRGWWWVKRKGNKLTFFSLNDK